MILERLDLRLARQGSEPVSEMEHNGALRGMLVPDQNTLLNRCLRTPESDRQAFKSAIEPSGSDPQHALRQERGLKTDWYFMFDPSGRNPSQLRT